MRAVVEHGACPRNSEIASQIPPWRDGQPVGSEGVYLPRGEAVPLRQVARLANKLIRVIQIQLWRKWTLAEAQDSFLQTGLILTFAISESSADDFDLATIGQRLLLDCQRDRAGRDSVGDHYQMACPCFLVRGYVKIR